MSNFFSDKDIKCDEKGDVPEFAMEVVNYYYGQRKKPTFLKDGIIMKKMEEQ